MKTKTPKKRKSRYSREETLKWSRKGDANAGSVLASSEPSKEDAKSRSQLFQEIFSLLEKLEDTPNNFENIPEKIQGWECSSKEGSKISFEKARKASNNLTENPVQVPKCPQARPASPSTWDFVESTAYLELQWKCKTCKNITRELCQVLNGALPNDYTPPKSCNNCNPVHDFERDLMREEISNKYGISNKYETYRKVLTCKKCGHSKIIVNLSDELLLETNPGECPGRPKV